MNDGSAIFTESAQGFDSGSCYGVGLLDFSGNDALVVLSVNNNGPTYVWFNDVVILVPEDDFESGDTSAWSVTVP